MELRNPDGTLSPHAAASSSQSKQKPQEAVASRQKSCDNCRDRKKRCDREQPCDRCDKLGLKCIFTKRPRTKYGRTPVQPAADRPSRLPPRAARLKAAAAVIDEDLGLSEEEAFTASPIPSTAVVEKDNTSESEVRLKQASEPIELSILQTPNANIAPVLERSLAGTITPLSPRVLLNNPTNQTILLPSKSSVFASSSRIPQHNAYQGSTLADDLSLHFNGGSNFNNQAALASATQTRVTHLFPSNNSIFPPFGQPYLPSSQILPHHLPIQQNQRPLSAVQLQFQNYNPSSFSTQNQLFNSLQHQNTYLNSVSSRSQFLFPPSGLTLPGQPPQIPWQSVPAPFQLQSSSSIPMLNFSSNIGYSEICHPSFFFGDDKKAGE